MKKAILTLIIVCILWVHTTSAMMPEVEEKFIQTSEGILSNLENNQTFSRNADSTSLREKILNPDFLEAEKFIDSLWLSEEDTTVLKHYNIHKNQQPLIGVPVLSGEEVMQQLKDLKKKHAQSLFSSRSPMLPSYYNRNAAVNYARRWALNPNPRYPYYTQNGDCTNFVSQALRAGGLRDIHGRRDWAQYWFFNNKNDLSMSWSNAHSFARHVRENPDRYTITNDLSTLTPWDIIAVDFYKDNSFNHVMMVTSGRFGIGIKLTYHSEDTKDLPYEDFLFRSLGIPMNFMHIKLN